jgi:hypothetical protein
MRFIVEELARVEARCFQGRQKLTSFGVSGKARLLPHDRTNGGRSKKDWL